MAANGSQHLLKVFSGPHLGAEVILDIGECVVGSDDSCDIVFADRFIAPRHAKLAVGADSVECAALEDAKVLIGGQEVDSKELQPFEYFTLGNTHLAIGPADAEWPATSFPDFRLEVTAAREEDTPEAEASEPAEQAKTEQEASDKAVADEVVPATATSSGGSSSWRIAVASLLLLFLLLPFGLFLMASSTSSAETATRPDEGEVRAALETVIRRYNHAGSVAVVDWRGKQAAEGFVSTAEERSALNDALGAALTETLGRVERKRLRVWDTERLVTAANDTIAMYQIPADATAGDPGEVVLSGDLPDQATREKLVARVTEDVPRIGKLTDQTTLPGEAAKAVPGAQPTVALVPKAAPAPRSQPVEVAAKAPEQRAAEVVKLPPIRSVNVGASRSLTLGDGQRLYPGSLLRNGYTVSQIDADRVILIRGESKKVIRIGI